MLSRNYPPSEALTRPVARYNVFTAVLPADLVIIDKLLSDTAFVRILLGGNWAAEIEPGSWRTAGQAVLFGPNSRPLRVPVQGAFHRLRRAPDRGGAGNRHRAEQMVAIAALERRIAVLHEELDPQSLLKGNPGVGQHLAPTILGVLHTARRLHSERHIRGFCGPFPKRPTARD